MSDVTLTIDQAEEVILAQFKTTWDALHPDVPYVFENNKTPQATSTAWCRVTVRYTDERQWTLGIPGQRMYRRACNAWVQLFGALDAGKRPLNLLAQDARKIYEGAGFGGVDSTDSARVNIVGSDGRWYEVVVVCPLAYYETR